MSTQREIDILQAVRSGDVVDVYRALERRDSEAISEGGYYEDSCPEIGALEDEVQVLRARLAARDRLIDRQQAQIRDLLRATK